MLCSIRTSRWVSVARPLQAVLQLEQRDPQLRQDDGVSLREPDRRSGCEGAVQWRVGAVAQEGLHRAGVARRWMRRGRGRGRGRRRRRRRPGSAASGMRALIDQGAMLADLTPARNRRKDLNAMWITPDQPRQRWLTAAARSSASRGFPACLRRVR